MRPLLRSLALPIAIACVGPVSALAAETADMPVLERAWHACVREAYDRQPEQGGKIGRERKALDACKAHENAYVAALMATRPEDADQLMYGWAKTWAAYVAYVVDPVAAWIEALRR